MRGSIGGAAHYLSDLYAKRPVGRRARRLFEPGPRAFRLRRGEKPSTARRSSPPRMPPINRPCFRQGRLCGGRGRAFGGAGPGGRGNRKCAAGGRRCARRGRCKRDPGRCAAVAGSTVSVADGLPIAATETAPDTGILASLGEAIIPSAHAETGVAARRRETAPAAPGLFGQIGQELSAYWQDPIGHLKETLGKDATIWARFFPARQNP